MIYYVDSEFGCDEYDGSSRQSAFQTLNKINSMTLKGGDRVLLKAGCIFHDSLCPKREEGEEVIVFDRYGAGNKPVILPDEGNGIDLTEFSFIEINNLAIRNPKGACGIEVHNSKGGCKRHIHIKNCDISDVQGAWESFGMLTGGIIFKSFTFSEPSWFDDVLLEDNTISNVSRSGIYLSSVWVNRPKRTWGQNEYVSDEEGWWPSYNVVIRGNRVTRSAGDGIVVLGAVSPLLEWNVVKEAMYNPPKKCFNAGLWVQSTNDAVLQYNEVGNMHLPPECTDGQGYDIDLSNKRALVQYNYSHDNGGGFILICETGDVKDRDNPFVGSIVRNNVSVNDGKVKGELIAVVGPVEGTTVCNNTFYAKEPVERVVEFFSGDGKTYASNMTFQNNIFIMDGVDNQFHILGDKADTIVFDNNLYWGKHCEVPASHTNAHVMDPQLENPGRGGDGRAIANAYRPKEESPVRTCGAPVGTIDGIDFSGHGDGDTTPYLGAWK